MTKIHVEIALATKRIRLISRYFVSSYVGKLPKSIALIQPTRQDFADKIEELDNFLARNPEVLKKFQTMEDGSGIVGMKYLTEAKQILSRMK